VHLAVGHVPLVGTLEAGLAQVEADWQEGLDAGIAGGAPPSGYAQAAKRTFGPILSLLLYLSAEDADYVRPAWPALKRTKLGWRLFPADKPTVWDVGERIGAALRRSVADRGEPASHTDSGLASPRPHIRGPSLARVLARALGGGALAGGPMAATDPDQRR
jgi:hypothetical protein